MENLDVMRLRNNEFFNREQILVEKNLRLDELCTSNKIEEQARKVWDSNHKASNPPSEDNRLAMRLRVTQEREVAMLENYDSQYRNFEEQNLINDHFLIWF